MYHFLITFFIFSITYSLHTVNCARILCVFPSPSLSHQFVFSSLTQELAKRGHELVIVTPMPGLAENLPIDNITEIDVSISRETLDSIKKQKPFLKRGVIADPTIFLAQNNVYYDAMAHILKEQLKNPGIKSLVEDKQQFDLILMEAYIYYPLIFSHTFKAPVIMFSSFYGPAEIYKLLGAVSWHPILYPHVFRTKFNNLSFLETLSEIYMEYQLNTYYENNLQRDNELLKEVFGPDIPKLDKLLKNVEMLFVNSHPIMDNNRPVPPNVVYLGSIHLQPVKKLPQDLQNYLDSSSRGVVYVSLGTNVHISHMEKDLLEAFLKAFNALPYEVLWKSENSTLDNLPRNVKIQKWFPQRDLLAHQNIKAFVTQGGLQSMDEAIDAGVPLIGIPLFGDQWYNVNKYVELGIGVQVDAMTLDADKLVAAVRNVIENSKYKTNIKRLSGIIRDQPQRPLDRAVWWTEHVLRHGGARHLRTPAANMSWTEYLMLDIFVTLTVILFSIPILFCITFHYMFRFVKNIFIRNGKQTNRRKIKLP